MSMALVNRLQRLGSRIRRFRSMDNDLLDRVYVERKLIAVYEGQREPPTGEECMEWARRLGIPKPYRHD